MALSWCSLWNNQTSEIYISEQAWAQPVKWLKRCWCTNLSCQHWNRRWTPSPRTHCGLNRWLAKITNTWPSCLTSHSLHYWSHTWIQYQSHKYTPYTLWKHLLRVFASDAQSLCLNVPVHGFWSELFSWFCDFCLCLGYLVCELPDLLPVFAAWQKSSL